MAKYVDGCVIVLPKKNLEDYKKMASEMGEVWMRHGALSYFETISEDLEIAKRMGSVSFDELTKAKKDEVIVFSFIVYKSKADRDRINKIVIEETSKSMKHVKMPFEMKRMTFGGFDVMVEY